MTENSIQTPSMPLVESQNIVSCYVIHKQDTIFWLTTDKLLFPQRVAIFAYRRFFGKDIIMQGSDYRAFLNIIIQYTVAGKNDTQDYCNDFTFVKAIQ